MRGHRAARRRLAGGLVLVAGLICSTGVAAQQSDADLAAAAQNPVAATYSLPFQNNIFGGAGPNHDAIGNVLNIQPVLPFTLGHWNIISRTIAPLIYVPGWYRASPTIPALRPALVRCSVSATSIRRFTSRLPQPAV